MDGGRGRGRRASPEGSTAASLELRAMLLQHGVALSVLFDLLVERGLVTRDEVRERAALLRQALEAPESRTGPQVDTPRGPPYN